MTVIATATHLDSRYSQTLFLGSLTDVLALELAAGSNRLTNRCDHCYLGESLHRGALCCKSAENISQNFYQNAHKAIQFSKLGRVLNFHNSIRNT